MVVNPTQPPTLPPRVALAHDFLVGYRGGEAVLESIAAIVREQFQPAGLYAMFARRGELPLRTGRQPERHAALRQFGPPRVAWPSRLPAGAGSLRRWLLPIYPAAVADLSRQLARAHAREPIDLLISTSSAAIKGLRPPPGVPHLCYCHSPARYLWSQTAEYARGGLGGLRSAGLRLFGKRLREWDRRTSSHVTRFLANSTHTAREIERCYGRESVVVFPPVDTGFFRPPPASEPRADHWLYVGALEPYKRVDLAIAAANAARHPLVIVGEGSQSAHLRSIAGPTVAFRGRINDDDLRREHQRARLLVFPQIEDFGIVAVEAQACGTPVLAFAAGGSLDTVIEGQTGAFFREATPESLVEAAARVPEVGGATSKACRDNAERFAESVFVESARRQIDDLLGSAASERRSRPVG